MAIISKRIMNHSAIVESTFTQRTTTHIRGLGKQRGIMELTVRVIELHMGMMELAVRGIVIRMEPLSRMIGLGLMVGEVCRILRRVK